MVHIRNGMCNCKQGISDGFYKHLAAIYKFFDLNGNNFPSVIIEVRSETAHVALRKNIPEYSYFLLLHVNELTTEDLKAPDNKGNVDHISTSILIQDPQNAIQPQDAPTSDVYNDVYD